MHLDSLTEMIPLIPQDSICCQGETAELESTVSSTSNFRSSGHEFESGTDQQHKIHGDHEILLSC